MHLKNLEIEINPEYECKCFILIHKYKKCIEITIKGDKTIDTNECYIFDVSNKLNKNKLLFNLNKKEYPFISIIPHNSPYLCYFKDNHYYLEFILSSISSKNYSNKTAYLYKKDSKNYDMFSMYKIKISPSFIFPTIDSLLKKLSTYI